MLDRFTIIRKEPYEGSSSFKKAFWSFRLMNKYDP